MPPRRSSRLLARLAALTEAPGPDHRCLRAAGRPMQGAGRSARGARARGAGRRASAAPPTAPRASTSSPSRRACPRRRYLALELSAHAGRSRARAAPRCARRWPRRSSAGGQGSRDGGRTRGLLLRRAAQIAHRDLGDVDKAFNWLGDALIAHVDDRFARRARRAWPVEVDDLKRAEATLGRALEEVFDGPLVRQLLAGAPSSAARCSTTRRGAADDLEEAARSVAGRCRA